MLVENLRYVKMQKTLFWKSLWKNYQSGWDLPLSVFKNFRYLSSAGNNPEGHLNRIYKVGSELSGFQINKVENVPELQLCAVRLQHIRTGADYLHIERNDPNNVFCIGFRTTPMNSTGVPHILEHLVLCGSEKYPCRDPFFKMINRSLSTFMNAMTGSDYTIYPFSTQHHVDYNNLMNVYLDSVFKPNLSELDFLQEGWRLEHEYPDKQSSPLVFKGVVFNEMKGVFADSQSIFLQKLQNGLLPSHTYGYVSGGDPIKIPDLSWRDLKDFHAKHYHPSNSRIFTYGNLPLENHLKFINDNYLCKFQKINPNTEVPMEPRWDEFRRAHIHCGFDTLTDKKRQSSLAISFLLTNIQNISENFTLAILSELLMSGPNSPFYKSLIESQYGSNFSVGSGFDGQTQDTSFTIGIQGVDESQLDEIINVIDKTFNQTIAEGFPKEQIEVVLHNLELGIKHQTANFGLNLAMSLTPLWNHNGDPIEALSINKKIDSFRNTLRENPGFLQSKLEHYFKNNKHKYILTMSPEENYENMQLNAEKELLKKKIEVLSDQSRESIFVQGQLLKSKQEEKEDISCLPTLHISDIPRSILPTITKDLNLKDNVSLQLCEQPTNGVTYFRAILDLEKLPENFHSLIPLFCGVLTEMGAGNLDFRALSQKMGLVSGGLSANTHIAEDPENLGNYEKGIILSSHCLHNNFEAMLELWVKILNEVVFDDISRFTTLIKMFANEKSNSLVYSGHNYAMSYAASSVNFVSNLKEHWSGLTNMQMLKNLSELDDLTETLYKMREMASILLRECRLRVAINTLAETSHDSVDKVEKFLSCLEVIDSRNIVMSTVPSSFQPQTCHTHHVFPFPVNFTAKSFSCLPYIHPDSGTLRVLARLMFQFLHREIREKGGAYGGGAISNPGGPFSFYSYRDPHSTRTLKTFDDAIEWVLTGTFTRQDVNEAKLGIFQSLDAPVSPGSKGMRRFINHVADEMFNEHRLSVLDTEPQDIIRACGTYLKEATREGSCLIGPQNEALEKDPCWITQNHG